MIIDIVLYYGQGRGGLEDVIAKVSRGLKNKGHRVRVFQAYRPQYIEWEEKLDEIYYYGEDIPWGSYLEQYGNGYKKLLESMDKPNIVIATHVPLQSYICHVAVNEGSEKKTPIISWIHGPIDFYGGRNFLQYSDAHLAIGENVMEDLAKTINREKIFVVGNPVEVKNQKICKRPDRNLKLLFVGRFSNVEKRLDVLFKALALVKEPWNIKLIGDGIDHDMIVKLAEDLKIYNHIEWTGWKENPWDYVDEASALILTSDLEGFGLVVVEALARGIPVISTSCGGPTYMIKDGVNGWLIEREDYLKLAELINKIQNGDLDLPKVKSCVDSVLKYDVDNVVDNIEKVLIRECNTGE
ncbi:glycosyltransferase [uncultured Clostridium sp.]|uniref:glycosyltransferase n=1 Tax=uncultured Clostridium sp. TaxID=59620 RepID=UPI0025CF6CC6|nr:glycosyltransferase [uncultured Clostridium sp.]